MRVTQSQAYRAQLLDARRKRAKSAEASREASSGKRLERPSDDPGGARQALLVRGALEDYSIGREKIDRAGVELERRESALAHITNSLSRARELAVQMSSDIMSGSERTAAAAEVAELRQTIIHEGNAEFLGRRLFAGALTDADAFDANGAYVGDSNAVSVELPAGASAEVTADGGALLRGTGGAQDVIGTLEGLLVALETNDVGGVRASLDGLDASIDHVIESRAGIGSQMSAIERLDELFESQGLALEERRTELEEVDLVDAYSAVIRTRDAYEQSLRVMSQSRTPSIFEML